MIEFTNNQIDGLAPDPASIKAGKSLANISKWKNIGFSDIALWGECQGSGANPYKSQIDSREFVFKCSCPSRKFPCKHGLGLMYLFVASKNSFGNEIPNWVKEWIESRDSKKQKQEEKKEIIKEIDPIKKAKTEEKRFESINQGLNDLEIWLNDFIRKGFDSIRSESYSFFNNIASRMVDYKASGISRRLKELSSISSTGKDNDLLLKKLNKIFLLIKAFIKIETLPIEIQEDIKTQIGITKTQEEVLSLNGIKDTWFVLGSTFEEDDNLKTKKTFLFGVESKKIAMVLDFSIAKKPFTNLDLVSGRFFDGELVYYPSNLELRALFKNKNLLDSDLKLNIKTQSINDLYELYSESLAKNSFIEKIPSFITNVKFNAKDENNFIIFDGQDNFIDINKEFKGNWDLLINSKNQEITIFGEFDGNTFFPIAIHNDIFLSF